MGKAFANEDMKSIAVEGEQVDIDFFDVMEWEKHELGIFSPSWQKSLGEEKINEYKNHMQIQLKATKEFRQTYLSEESAKKLDKHKFPPLVVASTNTVPTLNQILRRKRNIKMNERDASSWEYDYSNGRCVKGDGRIDYDKSFPLGVEVKKVQLNSTHAKQMCWESNGKFSFTLNLKSRRKVDFFSNESDFELARQLLGGNWGVIWGEVCNQVQSYAAWLESTKGESMEVPAIEDPYLTLRKGRRLRPKRFVLRIKTWREKRKMKRRVKLLRKIRTKKRKIRTRRFGVGSRRH